MNKLLKFAGVIALFVLVSCTPRPDNYEVWFKFEKGTELPDYYSRHGQWHVLNLSSIDDGGFTLRGADKNIWKYVENIIEIKLPPNVTKLGFDAFNGCVKVKRIDLPENLSVIGPYAFIFCRKLPQLEIPKNVHTIEEGAFWDCSSLKRIEIPEGVTEILSETFISCSNLTDVKIPSSVTKIADSAFRNCDNLTTIKVPVAIFQVEQEEVYEEGD